MLEHAVTWRQQCFLPVTMRQFTICIRHRVLPKRKTRADNLARMADRRGANRVLVGRPKGKRPFERPSRRQDLLKRVLNQMGGHELDWAGSRYEWPPPVNMAVKLRNPQNSGKCLTSQEVLAAQWLCSKETTKTHSVRITYHWGAFAKQLLSWKSHKCFIFWICMCL
jgi:hypothetical protein